LAKAAMAKGDLPADQQKAILKDLEDFNRAVQAGQADAGASLAFTFLTDRGYEGYAYDWGTHPGVDGSKPLTLLNHVGGDPILAAVGRGKVSVEGYEQFAKGAAKAFARADEVLKSKLTGDDKERYLKATADLLPLCKRLDEATDKLFLPALADGQMGLLLDAKWTSKQWFKALPETDKPMPGPEVAVVLGVSDADKLRKAMAEYREVVNEALAKIRTWKGAENMPEIQVPPPKEVKKQGGTLYYYPLPEAWGVDPQVAPTAGLSNDTAALTLSLAHAERLLASKPLKVDGGPLADRDRPLTGAMYFNWPGVVDAVAPWVEYATNRALDDQLGPGAPPKAREDVLKQVRTVLDVLRCWRGATAATYLEDGALVTHSESVYRDLEK
jgi:hypothetical protein